MRCREKHSTTFGPSLAPAYSSDRTYSAGEWVLHGDGYYMCIEGIKTPEEWTRSHWELHANILGEVQHPQSVAIKKVAPYLASVSFSSTDFNEAKKWADSASWGSSAGGCTVFGKGAHAYRWYDWTYDHACPIVVHVVGGYDNIHLHSVAGVAAMGEKFPESGKIENGIARFIPNRLVDGMNDSMLFAEMNAVPINSGDTGWHGCECPTVLSIYECLSRFSTARDAAEWLSGAVYVPPKYVEDTGFTVHYFIKDLEEEWIVEDGVARLVTGSAESHDFPAMTNFRCYSPSGGRPDPAMLYEEVQSYDDHGAGLERYADAVALASSESVSDSDIAGMRYSLSYTLDGDVPLRPSDFVGVSYDGIDIKVSNCRSPEATDVIKRIISAVTPRRRNDGTWQSVHVADYNLQEGTFRIWTQEDFENPYTFGLFEKAAECGCMSIGSKLDRSEISADNDRFRAAVEAIIASKS